MNPGVANGIIGCLKELSRNSHTDSLCPIRMGPIRMGPIRMWDGPGGPGSGFETQIRVRNALEFLSDSPGMWSLPLYLYRGSANALPPSLQALVRRVELTGNAKALVLVAPD